MNGDSFLQSIGLKADDLARMKTEPEAGIADCFYIQRGNEGKWYRITVEVCEEEPFFPNRTAFPAQTTEEKARCSEGRRRSGLTENCLRGKTGGRKLQGSSDSESEKESRDDLLMRQLTRRQREVVRLMAEGCSNREIAGKLMISENTVRKHVENIRCVLGTRNRISALRKLKLIS